MTAAILLSAYPLVSTSRIDELEASIARIFARPRMELVNRGGALQAVHNHCRLQTIGLTYGSYGVGARFEFSETACFAQVFPLGGNVEFVFNGVSFAADSNSGVVIPINTGFKMVSDAGYERLNLVIDPAALTAKLHALLGLAGDVSLKIHPGQNVNGKPARLLRGQVMFLAKQLSSALPLPALLLTEIEQTILAMFLRANRHNYSDLLEQIPSDVGIRQVRRAEEYIEANCDKPVSFEALAAVTNVGMRALFHKFGQIRGYSPMDFLEQNRLRRARQMLLNAEASTTVVEAALACGFGNLDRFNSDYYSTFGEFPSETLAGGKNTKLTLH